MPPPAAAAAFRRICRPAGDAVPRGRERLRLVHGRRCAVGAQPSAGGHHSLSDPGALKANQRISAALRRKHLSNSDHACSRACCLTCWHPAPRSPSCLISLLLFRQPRFRARSFRPGSLPIVRVQPGVAVQMKMGTWHAGPYFDERPVMDFWNLEARSKFLPFFSEY